jgi:vancomycin permeability regulator SanA
MNPFKIVFRIISLMVIIVIAIPTMVVGRVWWSGTHPVENKSDVAIVLGAAQFNGRPGPVLEARLKQARILYKANVVDQIITVGAGAPGDQTTEGAAGKYWLVNHGVKNSATISVPKGRDTLASTKAYAKVVAGKKVLVVTDPWHCLRATTMAKDSGILATCSPVKSGPNSVGSATSKYLLRESVAYLAYITLGRAGINLSDH